MENTTDDLLARREKLLGPAYRLFYDRPVHLVRGAGVWLYDDAGRKYLDMYNNVPHVGHCHPHVVDAICRQAGTLNTHTRYLHDTIIECAERLTDKLPAELDTAMFCCTGSEANELALRIARSATGRKGVIVADYAYHGNTQAIYEITTSDIPAEDLPGYVVTVPAPDTYRGRYRDDDAAARYAAHVHEAIALLQSRGFEPAAFVIDTIVSSSGVVEPPRGYLAAVAAIVRDAGALFIADEVQPGFGRTGRNFWGFEADGLVPDIVTMGKPMGNGHPVSAVVVRRALVEDFGRKGRLFQYLRRQPGFLRRGAGRPRRHRGGRPAAERARGRAAHRDGPAATRRGACLHRRRSRQRAVPRAGTGSRQGSPYARRRAGTVRRQRPA